ncbi:DUF3072 domain-containing protein [Streptomyces sp. NP160]|uniref:DUF3072 domain-containing protein n=1 Tax=Streptomyces sp. NP160 TaxID=2586637 RepID=UPI001119B899|nr:DUF3072 domain-containing protein [Streptomyces sp. NP160]TNM61156.1 DUF3072 domain-containing protein [Streptomyces sp. NP160]
MTENASSHDSRPPAQTAPDQAGTGSQADPTAVKDPETWATGDEPATGAQLSYLRTLATEAGEQVPDDLSKAHASEMIDELKSRSARVSEG